MKKTISVFLAVLLTLFCMAPAFAADGSHTVNFSLPGAGVGEGAYSFVKCGGDGNFAEYAEAPELYGSETAGYVYYLSEEERQGDPATEEGGDYYLYAGIIFDDDKALFDGTRYLPVCYNATETVEDGEQVIFRVVTNEVYDASSVVIEVGGQKLEPRPGGEYAVTVTGDITISVREDVLLRNHFTVALTSGDGYSVKTLKNENNRYAYYGDSFNFRVRVSKGFTANDMKVTAVKTGNDLSELFGEEFDAVIGLIDPDATQQLNCIGQDDEGCYLYRLDNIDANMKILVSGVKEESQSGILAILKRILRFILHAFGINTDNIPFLNDLVGEEKRVYVNKDLKSSIKCELSMSADTKPLTDEEGKSYYPVLTNEGVMITLTTKDPEHAVNITVVRDDPTASGTKALDWTAKFNKYTAETTWTATYFVSSITEDKVTITLTSMN